MTCFICYNPVDQGCDSDVNLSTFCKLLSLTCQNDLLQNDLLLFCVKCQSMVEQVEEIFDKLNDLRQKLTQLRSNVHKNLIKSQELSVIDGHTIDQRTKIVEELLSRSRLNVDEPGLEPESKYYADPEADFNENDASAFFDHDQDYYILPTTCQESKVLKTQDRAEDRDQMFTISGHRYNGRSSTSKSMIIKPSRVILERITLPPATIGDHTITTCNINEEPISSFILRDTKNKKLKTNRKGLVQSSKRRKVDSKISNSNDQSKNGSKKLTKKTKKLKEDKMTEIKDKYEYQCQACDRKFSYLKNLNSHVEANHPESYSDFIKSQEKAPLHVCHICPKSFPTLYQLKLHLCIHGVGDGVVYCDQCNYFGTKRLVNIHKLAKHNPTSVKTYICDQCGKLLLTSNRLYIHRKIHDTVRPEYICDFDSCTKRFKHKYTLDYHMKSHTQVHEVTCTICNKVFYSPPSLKRHILRTHEKSFRFWCTEPDCPKGFVNEYEQKLHINSAHRIGDKCPHCEYHGFGYTMRKHIWAKHPEQDSFPCEFQNCSKKFKNLLQLKRHLKVHANPSKYTCTICSKLYTNMYNLRQHKKLFHAE